eukprot:scaffold368_cov258-Pinguiococcus_pyrenoidosus.AAC.22
MSIRDVQSRETRPSKREPSFPTFTLLTCERSTLDLGFGFSSARPGATQQSFASPPSSPCRKTVRMWGRPRRPCFLTSMPPRSRVTKTSNSFCRCAMRSDRLEEATLVADSGDSSGAVLGSDSCCAGAVRDRSIFEEASLRLPASFSSS